MPHGQPLSFSSI